MLITMYDHSTRGPKPVGHPVLNIYQYGNA